jgi:ferredoxin
MHSNSQNSNQPNNSTASNTATTTMPDEIVRTIGNYQIKLIRPKCIAAASCVALSPEIFELDEESLVKFVDGVADPDTENVLLSAQSCPTAAIIIIDIKTGQQLWPTLE